MLTPFKVILCQLSLAQNHADPVAAYINDQVQQGFKEKSLAQLKQELPLDLQSALTQAIGILCEN